MNQPNKVKPIFIFSLPRTGSTLLQRIIGADDLISFSGEPWILLPFFYSMKKNGVFAEYNHKVMTKGTQSFTDYLPRGKQDYYAELKTFAERLYRCASDSNAKYFIDKTPRYHFIVDEILKTFDDAKFIFLWRNPLAVQASCIETWCSGKWNIQYFDQDQYGGLERLIKAYDANRERSWAINYEELISDPELILKPLFEEYLQINFNPEILNKFIKHKSKRGLGDRTGVKMYSSVNKAPLDKWKITMAGVLRKRWCYQYLDWIGDKRLNIMGYKKENLIKEVSDLPRSISGVFSDLIRMAYAKISHRFEKIIFRGK